MKQHAKRSKHKESGSGQRCDKREDKERTSIQIERQTTQATQYTQTDGRKNRQGQDADGRQDRRGKEHRQTDKR